MVFILIANEFYGLGSSIEPHIFLHAAHVISVPRGER
jgi:hypothetical protein